MKRFLACLCLLAAFSSATEYAGDGVYRLALEDLVISSNGMQVYLTDAGWYNGRDGSVVVKNATYSVRYQGDAIAEVTLSEGKSFTAQAEGGARNVTISVRELGAVVRQSGTSPYATTEIASATAPPTKKSKPLAIWFFEVYDYMNGVSVHWKTNGTANGTLLVYKGSDPAPVRTIYDPGLVNERFEHVFGLESDTLYYFRVIACGHDACDDYNDSYKTPPVIPTNSDIEVTDITNESAIVKWRTDVPSAPIVYYRKNGTAGWERMPPKAFDLGAIKKYIKITASAEAKPAAKGGLLLEAPGTERAESGSLSLMGASETGLNYSIQADYIDTIGVSDALGFIKDWHEVRLDGLHDGTDYELIVSSCADLCHNSSIRTFKTLANPFVYFISKPSDVHHGSSAVMTISAYSRNPKGKLTSVSLSWEDEGMKRMLHPQFGGEKLSIVPEEYPTMSVLSVTFADPGPHELTLTATDDYNITASASITINVEAKAKCKSTKAKYYPYDTSCTNKWPNDGQAGVAYGSLIGACHAFEVCDDSLDYMVEDAEKCCNGDANAEIVGTPIFLFSAKPEKLKHKYDKTAACKETLKEMQDNKIFLNFSDENTMKICKATFLVKGIGSQAIYMKDYYTGEGCCAAASFCDDSDFFFTPYPWPQSNIKFKKLWCTYEEDVWGDYYPVQGWHDSDTDPEQNNVAMAVPPTHSTVNVMNTGTCVDYSFVTTTALRKAGFKKNEILSVSAPGHAYNFVWLPGDGKYTFIDTVGNRAGEFFTGKGWAWVYDKKNVNHCSYDPETCANDGGMRNCPSKSQVVGC